MEVSNQISQSEQLLRTGRFAEAIDLLTAILAEDPSDRQALLNVGIAYTEHGENDKAIKALTHYVADDKANPEAWEALGCAYLRKGEYPSAETHLRAAQELAPDNASILRNLSVLLSRTGRGKESFHTLQRAHELNGSDYLTTYALALAYLGLGDRENAQSLFEEMLAFFPGLPKPLRDDIQMKLVEFSIGW